MEEKIEEEMAEIEKQGGMVAGIKSGFVQRKVAWQAYQFERDLQHGELIKVGVNKYHTTEDEEVELHEYNEAWAESQLADLADLKRTRDQGAVTASLKALEAAARAEHTNVMPMLVDCCLAYATVGEMADVFRDVYGTFKEPSIC